MQETQGGLVREAQMSTELSVHKITISKRVDVEDYLLILYIVFLVLSPSGGGK